MCIRDSYYTARKYNGVRDAQLQQAGQGDVPLVGGPKPVLLPIEQYLRDNTAPDFPDEAADDPRAGKPAETVAPGSVEGE